jgi:hypothetical protein
MKGWGEAARKAEVRSNEAQRAIAAAAADLERFMKEHGESARRLLAAAQTKISLGIDDADYPDRVTGVTLTHEGLMRDYFVSGEWTRTTPTTPLDAATHYAQDNDVRNLVWDITRQLKRIARQVRRGR